VWVQIAPYLEKTSLTMISPTSMDGETPNERKTKISGLLFSSQPDYPQAEIASGAVMTASTETDVLDKVSEEQMAKLLGTTKRALQARRARKKIPEEVWMKVGRKIIYSKRIYDEWIESQWICQQEWKFSELHSAFGSLGMDAGAAKRSLIPSR
jgi:hypothetical protein